jgi:homoserine dehydrogenase
VSIASVIQHDPGDEGPDGPVPLILMTHAVVDADLRAAISEIDRLSVVKAPSTCYGVEE